jgi:hypothetical protein
MSVSRNRHFVSVDHGSSSVRADGADQRGGGNRGHETSRHVTP